MRRVLALFFLSGALGLGYQVLWSKFVLLFVGVSSWSYAIVLAAFMAGLALGSRAFGGLADRAGSPLRLFALLELGIGAYAVAYPMLVDAAGGLYLRLAAAPAGDVTSPRHLLLKAAVAGALLVPPTFLMGGTFPALVRHAATSAGLIGRRASQLYAVNAAGAVIGALAMAMAVMPSLGLRGSLMALALGNLAVGLAALAMARPAGVAPPAAEPVAPAAPSWMDARLLAPVIAFVAGALAFALEIAWTRSFAVIMGSSTQSFAVILAAFIAGIAGGSAILSRHEHRVRHSIALFGGLQLAAAALVLVPLPVLPYLRWALGRAGHALPTTETGYQAWGLAKLAMSLSIMLVPCLALGVSIPLLVKAVARRVETAGTDTGRVYAFNTAGNVAGALAAGMVALPAIGAERLIVACALALATTGAAALIFGSPRMDLRRVAIGAAAGLALVGALAAMIPRWDATWLSIASFRRQEASTWATARATMAYRRIVYMKDDPAASVIVLAAGDADDPQLSLLVNGKPDASTASDLPTQLLLGHLPVLLHGDARSVLVIGLASGITSGAILRHPVERLHVVDIVGCMPEAAAFFEPWSGAPLADPRTRFIADDARSHLMTTRDRHDIIVSEPSNPWTAGTGSLFSTEFYREASRRLAPGGLYVQWLQAYEISDELLAAVLRSFRAAFPHVTLWETSARDTILVGSEHPQAVDRDRMAAKLGRPAVAEQMAPLGFTTPGTVQFLQRFTETTVDWVASLSPLENTDDNLLLEHEAPRDLFLLRSPAALGRLDERRASAPGLGWVASLAIESETAASIPDLMADGVHGTDELRVAWLAARMRAAGGAVAEIPGALRPRLPRGAETPRSHDALVAELEAAVASADVASVATVLSRERAAIALACALSPASADAWNEVLGRLAADAGRATGMLRLAQADALAAAGRPAEALAAIDAAMAATPRPSDEELLTRACRIAPAEPCETLARRLLETTGDARLERFLDLRTRR